MARLEIDLDKIEHNARTIVELCHRSNIKVAGVTKGVGGMPQVARAMLKGGVSQIADARLLNIKRVRKAGIKEEKMLIRIPRITRSKEVLRYFDYSLISEWKVIQALSQEGIKMNKVHKILLMIDLGDLREGIMTHQAIPMVQKILTLRGVELVGIGTNLGCYGGILPTREKMDQLVILAREIEQGFGIQLSLISGGGTNCLPLVLNNEMPGKINHLRIGEGILLGRDSSGGTEIPNTFQDTFQLSGEIIEIKEKPSLPMGEIGKDAFGQKPEFKDQGIRMRAILALGKQDVRLSGLKPMDPDIKILGGSSDYIILDITESNDQYDIGSMIYFRLLYPSLLSAVTSPYVPHYIKEEGEWIKC